MTWCIPTNSSVVKLHVRLRFQNDTGVVRASDTNAHKSYSWFGSTWLGGHCHWRDKMQFFAELALKNENKIESLSSLPVTEERRETQSLILNCSSVFGELRRKQNPKYAEWRSALIFLVLFTPCAARTIIFERENLNYLIVRFTQCTLLFQKVCFLFRFYWKFSCRALSVGRM